MELRLTIPRHFISLVAVLVALILATTAVAKDQNDLFVLEDETVRLEITTKPVVSLQSMFDKIQNRYLWKGNAVPLYQMQYVTAKGMQEVMSDKAGPLHVRKLSDQGLSFAFEHTAEKVRWDIEILLEKATENPKARSYFSFSFSGKNGATDQRVGLLRFPGIPLTSPGDEKGLYLALPVVDGQIIEQPFRHLEGYRSYDYPGMASMQWMAFGDSKGGLLFFADDSTGSHKRLGALKHGKIIVPLFEHVLYGRPQDQLNRPYKIRIVPYVGPDWKSAAEVYREWALEQPWARASKPATPISLQNPSFFLGTHLRLDKAGKGLYTGDTLASTIAAWSKEFGLPFTAILLGWERHGPWIAPDYFPPFGGRTKFAALTDSLASSGSFSMAYLSGLNHTIEKTARHGASPYNANKDSLSIWLNSAIRGEDGKPKIHGNAEQGVGKYIQIQPTTPRAKFMLTSQVKELLTLGVDMVQIDQIVGGGVPPSFPESLRHKAKLSNADLAGFNWVSHIENLLKEARSLTTNQGKALSLEGPSEWFIPYVDIFHTREYMEFHWPRDGKGVRGASLFNFVYHEMALGYGGDSAPLAESDAEVDIGIYAQAANLREGRYPGAATWNRFPLPRHLAPPYREFLKKSLALWQGSHADFLRFGRILPMHLESKPMQIRQGANQFQAASLQYNLFQLESRWMAIFINISPIQQKINWTIPEGLALSGEPCLVLAAHSICTMQGVVKP